MTAIKSFLKENQALVGFLIGQFVIGLIYMTNLESRVSTLEVRGSPHLSEINTRLTTLEKVSENNNQRLDKVIDIMTRELHIAPERVK